MPNQIIARIGAGALVPSLPPVVVSGQSFSIVAGATIGSVVGQVASVAGDTPTTGFSIVSGNTGSKFAIDSDGVITTIATIVTAGFTLSITATNASTPGTSAPADVGVTVGAAAQAPVITTNGGDRVVFSVYEDTTDIAVLAANNPNGSGTLAWSLTTQFPDYALFAINASTGALTWVNPPDYENPLDFSGDYGGINGWATDNSYWVTARVTHSPSGLTDDLEINVKVLNVADPEAPVFTSGGAFSVVEGNTSVGTLFATGAAPITYSLVTGEDSTFFAINASTGVITFNAAPAHGTPADANADNAYQITGRATNAQGTATMPITVTVTTASVSGPVVPGPYRLDDPIIDRLAGLLWDSHTLADTTIGRRGSGYSEVIGYDYFRSTESARVSTIKRFFIVHPPNYSLGNGGIIQITIWPLGADGKTPNKSGSHHGQLIYYPNLVNGVFTGTPYEAYDKECPVLTFPAGAAPLVKGNLYVNEYVNIDADNYANHIGINNFGYAPPGPPSPDWILPTDWGSGYNVVGTSDINNSGVTQYSNRYQRPNMEMTFENGKILGFAIIITGNLYVAGRDRVRIFSSSNPIRYFIQPHKSRLVDRMYIYLSARVGGPFTWALKNDAGAVLASGSETAAPQANSLDGAYTQSRVLLQFPTVGIQLNIGSQYFVEVTPSAGTTLNIPPQHTGRRQSFQGRFSNPEHTAQQFIDGSWVHMTADPAPYGYNQIASYPGVICDK